MTTSASARFTRLCLVLAALSSASCNDPNDERVVLNTDREAPRWGLDWSAMSTEANASEGNSVAPQDESGNSNAPHNSVQATGNVLMPSPDNNTPWEPDTY
jgi:hypothetical protein